MEIEGPESESDDEVCAALHHHVDSAEAMRCIWWKSIDLQCA